MAKQTVITDEGLKKLEAELEELKTVKRKEVAEKIKVALGYGDLSENSEYDEAKNEQAIIEGRIAEIENQLKNVRVRWAAAFRTNRPSAKRCWSIASATRSKWKRPAVLFS